MRPTVEKSTKVHESPRKSTFCVLQKSTTTSGEYAKARRKSTKVHESPRKSTFSRRILRLTAEKSTKVHVLRAARIHDNQGRVRKSTKVHALHASSARKHVESPPKFAESHAARTQNQHHSTRAAPKLHTNERCTARSSDQNKNEKKIGRWIPWTFVDFRANDPISSLKTWTFVDFEYREIS